MNLNFKRALALVCTLAMLLTFASPALAAEDVVDVPVIGAAEQPTQAAAPATAAAEISVKPAPAAAKAKLQADPTVTISSETVEVGTGTADVTLTLTLEGSGSEYSTTILLAASTPYFDSLKEKV